MTSYPLKWRPEDGGRSLGVALPNLPYACETFGPLRYVHDILVQPIDIANGYLEPPDRPGLGIEVDWQEVNELHTQGNEHASNHRLP